MGLRVTLLQGCDVKKGGCHVSGHGEGLVNEMQNGHSCWKQDVSLDVTQDAVQHRLQKDAGAGLVQLRPKVCVQPAPGPGLSPQDQREKP